jgi:hypothetical protein
MQTSRRSRQHSVDEPEPAPTVDDVTVKVEPSALVDVATEDLERSDRGPKLYMDLSSEHGVVHMKSGSVLSIRSSSYEEWQRVTVSVSGICNSVMLWLSDSNGSGQDETIVLREFPNVRWQMYGESDVPMLQGLLQSVQDLMLVVGCFMDKSSQRLIRFPAQNRV